MAKKATTEKAINLDNILFTKVMEQVENFEENN